MKLSLYVSKVSGDVILSTKAEQQSSIWKYVGVVVVPVFPSADSGVEMQFEQDEHGNTVVA